MNRRPDIIIINPDEMRWDTMGHMGNQAASTPRLDAFAREEAVSFENAFCQNPVCVPSRRNVPGSHENPLCTSDVTPYASE